MEFHITISSSIQLITIAAGFTLALIFWNKAGDKNIANRFLSVSLFSISIWSILTFLTESTLITRVPHLYRLEVFFALLYMPFSYLYARCVIDRKTFGVSDLVHIFPAVLFLLDTVPSYALPIEQKSAIIQREIVGDVEGLSGWIFPAGYQSLLRNVLIAFYWLLQSSILLRFYNADVRSRQIESRTWRQWITIYTGMQLFLFAPYFLGLIFSAGEVMLFFTHLFAALTVLFTTATLVYEPQILYGLSFATNKNLSEQALVATLLEDESADSANRKKTAMVPRGEITLERLKRIMEEDRPFLLSAYTVRDLAHELKISPSEVTALLDRLTGLSFNDYLDQQRIFYSQERMRAGDANRLGLEALSRTCGFADQNAFTLAFKKFTTTTPSVYFQSLKDNTPSSSKQKAHK